MSVKPKINCSTFLDDAQRIISEIPDDKQMSGQEVKSMMEILFDYIETLENKHSNDLFVLRMWGEKIQKEEHK